MARQIVLSVCQPVPQPPTHAPWCILMHPEGYNENILYDHIYHTSYFIYIIYDPQPPTHAPWCILMMHPDSSGRLQWDRRAYI